MSADRRLVAVLSADAKGYSRLMAEDEIATVRTLTAHRDAMSAAIRGYHGRVVDSPGDNLLAEFPSAVDAVEAAVAIQRRLAEANAALPPERRLEFRIGVNLGEILADGERIYGDTVNVAARVEALAEAGGICVAGAVYDQVVTRLPYAWDALGEQAVKNIVRPVRVYRARLDGQAHAHAPAPAAARALVDRPSIGVLPFREFGVTEGDAYFGEGIVEDIIGALATVPDLFVVSRNSTSRFGQAAIDAKAVGRDLGVRYLLSGSLRRSGDRIRVVAELADAESQVVLWTDKIDGRADELFDLQDRLSEKTITTIAPQVQGAELRRALRKRPESLDSYDFVLRGLHLLYRLQRSEFDLAREMFERAIVLDPAYATPYALSAIWYSIRHGQGWSESLERDYAEVARLAEAALDRDPFDARALALCGHTRALIFHDYDGAIDLFDRALAASPNSAVAWVRSSPTYSYIGDAAEARRRAEMALRLSPLDPHLFYTYTALAFACYTGGAFDEAVSWGRKAMSQSPHYTANLRFLAASLAAAGRATEARHVGAALREVEPGFRVEAFCRRYAYRDPERRAALARHLIAAGLPA
ncbi:MAG: adenylate/guanylate cyclase domain-containing protein [Candidatus Rokubacteria bacterium]|nr:adenylate/guanylate cyclase domain-containing protein [Candidatus Rokubacteria bacterium]